ncbi:hypothetical protein EWB00_003503 [Schistosoma japonicum]|uniref:Uncharacterized protein n=1 Tax=Schistosoma japonicum TaxID=6182 RepID=A0A4Z2D8C5_SCHJA|nr:hypothetical protein EWB00_003503 [Schistosoma japonicum]
MMITIHVRAELTADGNSLEVEQNCQETMTPANSGTWKSSLKHIPDQSDTFKMEYRARQAY